MKTQMYSASEALACFEARIASGDVIHGSPLKDLDELKPMASGSLYVDIVGERIVQEPRIWATDNVTLAFFTAEYTR